MSKQLISQYHAELERIIQYGGSSNETSIRVAFQNLLNDYCKAKDFILIPELEFVTKDGKSVYPDGTVKDALRLDWGYWESKDESDDLQIEIDKKIRKGYPTSNILFEDSQTAVLLQSGKEVFRAPMKNADELDKLLTLFVEYERPEVQSFRKAILKFKDDLPKILTALRNMIETQSKTNKAFIAARQSFWDICKDSINPDISLADTSEMIIQHVLTEDIFISIFNEPQFHQENNVARELQKVIHTFFVGKVRRDVLGLIENYYAAIKAAASGIGNHHEKQKFLKALYEDFYKAYNPKHADRLGIVYTPNEIVQFMIQSTDFLVHRHFGKLLADKDVEILDPATGTGTFVTELIEYLPAAKLEHKYKHEIHCNEVAILPYYVANLNIEFTYKQKMKRYEEFQNICFVDTLDNTTALKHDNHQYGLDLGLGVENAKRIKEQNKRKISVIIGNPPYNANQANENDNNKNRTYPAIDQRIKDTYIEKSSAQKTKLYDMYSRFFRWASDRLNENGIVAFITNSSFIDSRTFDGFRKSVAVEFNEIYVLDLGGNVRANPKLSGTKHNVFGIQTGVAICFLIRKEKGFPPAPLSKEGSEEGERCRIFYARRPEMEIAADKLAFLRENKFERVSFDHIRPDKNGNWINQADNDFETLLPLATKDTKAVKEKKQERAVFKLFSLGVSTNRDEWVFDINQNNLIDKCKYFIERYNLSTHKKIDESIKWSESLKSKFSRGEKLKFDKSLVKKELHRPFFSTFFYAEKNMSDRLTDNHFFIFGNDLLKNNKLIVFTTGERLAFTISATSLLPNLNMYSLDPVQCLPLYRYDEAGNRVENITDWGLEQFRRRYETSPVSSPARRGAGENPLSEREGRVRVLPALLIEAARELRRKATDAEKLMWGLLRNRQLEGFKFRRQHPIQVKASEGKRNFILDFYCHEARLCVELDGGHHAKQNQAAADAERTALLKAEGITVIRFWNNDVLNNTESVLQNIYNVLLGEMADAGKATRDITKEDIFHYTYAVLHHPSYRKKYELNLKREFPRLPFYDDFFKWAAWGKRLMDLHLDYETAKPFALKEIHSPFEKGSGDKTEQSPKAKLKADKDAGTIVIDEATTLSGVPSEVWDYKLGNRSAVEWVLDQYKESTPKDPTIAKDFNTYRFSDYKKQVIELVKRVCTVSVETMQVIREMENDSK
jgi:predicted helicase